MKVIGSGFGRTGTTSMKAALEQLGFGPCYHMEEVLASSKRIEAWYNIAQGQPADWQTLFQGYKATVDFPASTYYKELVAAFPDAKVIHTVRDPENWYDSTRETIYQASVNVFPGWLQRSVKWMGQFVAMTNLLIWERVFQGAFEDRQRAIEKFNQYTDEVKHTVPAERLLIFNVGEGWKPLCQFLDVPVPNTPFPHLQDREIMKKRFQRMRIGFRVAPVILAVVVIAIAGIIVTLS